MQVRANSATSSFKILCAMSMLSAVLGTVHGFSVFLTPLGEAQDTGRNIVSLTYSLALVFITVSVLLGHRIYGAFSAFKFVVGIVSLAATGLILAAVATSMLWIWLGFGVVFGAANGLGYGFGLQFAARSNPARAGLAMGIITAAYALGAIIAPIGFSIALRAGGFSTAMFALAALIVCVGAVVAILVLAAGLEYSTGQTAQAGDAHLPGVFLWWVGYGAATFSGLMVIGHAQGIVETKGYLGANWHATAMISAFNLIGSLLGGQLVDRTRQKVPLVALPFLSMVAAILLVFDFSLFIALALVGFAYGGIIAAYPAAISKSYGSQLGTRVYGRVFTAWGAAGLAGPWLAGYIFDVQGTYQIALWCAAVLSAVSIVAIQIRES